MNIQKATQQYEAWLGEQTILVEADLALKHTQMTAGVLPFLRATFYRWAQVFPDACPQLAGAPVVLAVGDLHLENFGTWRDAEGRLVWGINDFDEAHQMPYTVDLVRLAASAVFAEMRGESAPICDAILEGYEAGLKAGGRPFVLAEDHVWLRETALRDLGDPVQFWNKMAGLPEAEKDVPVSARESLEHLLPRPHPPYRVARRRSGLGSLGHRRFVALAAWEGGQIARQAKALVPSAWLWVGKAAGPQESLYQAALSRSVRCRDPFVEVRGQWVLRRLAPDCVRVPLEALSGEKDERRRLRAMGWETANIHLGSAAVIADVRRDLDKRRTGWLAAAVEAMCAATERDWKEWKKAPL